MCAYALAGTHASVAALSHGVTSGIEILVCMYGCYISPPVGHNDFQFQILLIHFRCGKLCFKITLEKGKDLTWNQAIPSFLLCHDLKSDLQSHVSELLRIDGQETFCANTQFCFGFMICSHD